MTAMQEYVAACRENVRGAIAPLTTPNPHEAARIEAAINRLIEAQITAAFSNMPRTPLSG